jgi:ribosomal protein S18 acetylase RimI-like enzyme
VNDGEAAASRARAWHHARQELICDVAETWAHGVILRATRYPDYWDFNLVRVDEEPAMDVQELITIADEALADASHRRIDFDAAAAADPLRPGFEAIGWHALRLLYMRHEAMAPDVAGMAVEEVPYEAAGALRTAGHAEDFPGQDPGEYPGQAREVALSRGARVFAVIEAGEPIAFAQIEHVAGSAEITHVYVRSDRRGNGIGTAITRASIDAAGEVDDLWISADDEDRPKELYARLGFRPAWLSMELTRLP